MTIEQLGPPKPGNERQAFIERLESLAYEPHESVIAMYEEMGVDISYRIGLTEVVGVNDAGVIRAQTISPGQYDAIKSFEDIVKFLSAHGRLKPAQLGLWFNLPPKGEVDDRSTVDVLFDGFSEKDGFDKSSVRKILKAAQSFLTADEECVRQYWELAGH